MKCKKVYNRLNWKLQEFRSQNLGDILEKIVRIIFAPITFGNSLEDD